MITVAALYVRKGGPYFGVEGVDPWDESRDARLYTGPHPVVAHPPCARWCQLAGLVEARWGYKRGDDGGTFAAALAAVRKHGGVLEHPAYSRAFAAHGLPDPLLHGWQRTTCGGWVASVEQKRYGHSARKLTWLYAYGVDVAALRWTWSAPMKGDTIVSSCGKRSKAERHAQGDYRRRLTSREASQTPVEFRDALIAIARSAKAASPASPG
jgi:hypothetical protein